MFILTSKCMRFIELIQKKTMRCCVYCVCSLLTVVGAVCKCSGRANISTLVALSATPSGKFRSIYSKNVDNVEPVSRWKWMKWKYVRISYWTRCFLWTNADFNIVYRSGVYGNRGVQLKYRKNRIWRPFFDMYEQRMLSFYLLPTSTFKCSAAVVANFT